MASDKPGPPTDQDKHIADPEVLHARITALETEIAELRHANMQQAQSQERLQRIVEAARDHAIITLDPQGRITGWSRGATNLFGWAETEVLGLCGNLIFTPEDRAASAPEQERRTASQHGVAEDERWHICKDGHRVWLSGSLVPLRDAAGVLEGFLKVARDETKRRVAEEALREGETLRAPFSRQLSIASSPSIRTAASSSGT
jgi:PAS domain S-box-containing protein